MADYRQIARRAARRYGLDPSVFLRQINQESGFNPSARSPAGALGIAQFMPGTARGVGVDPLNPRQALYGAAKLMAGYVRKYGSYRDALVAYNAGPGRVGGSLPAETRNYVASILGGRNPSTSGVSSGGGGQPGAVLDLGGTSTPDLSSGNAVALLQALSQQSKPQPAPASLLPAPSFAATPQLPAGFQQTASSAMPAQPDKLDVGKLLSLVQTPGGQPSSGGSNLVALPPTAGGGGAGGGARLGRVSVAAGANRPGTRINPAVVNFVRQVAGLYGRPLTIGTGTNHSRLTINGTVSDHWSGNGADVPLTGRALIRAGQAALIAAGMPAARARRQTGGGFNVGDYQVIFNTDAPGWGNHLTHLHIGRRVR